MIYVNTVTADQLSHAYFDDIRVLGAYTSFSEALEESKKQLQLYTRGRSKIPWRIEIHSYGDKTQYEGALLKVNNRYMFRVPTPLGSFRMVPLKKVQILQ